MAWWRSLGALVTFLACAAFDRLPGTPEIWIWTFSALFSMWLFPDDGPTQWTGCNKLQQWGWNRPDAKTPLKRLGAMDLCAKAVRRWPMEVSVQATCLNCLGSLSLFNEENSRYAGDLGVVELVVRAQRELRMVVPDLVGCVSDFVPENRVRLRKAGGIKLWLEFCGVNGSHYWDAGAQFKTWCGFSSFHDTANYAEFHRHGGIESAVAVMRDHGKSYRVREEVLQCTRGMCGQARYRALFLEAGFLEVLLRALREDHGDPQVTALGLDSVRMLIETDPVTRGAFANSGGVDIAMQALRTHSAALLNTRGGNDPQHVYGDLNGHLYNVPGSALEVLSALALNGEATRREMLEAGVVDQVSESIVATRGRIQARRTFHGGCATLDALRAAAGEVDASTAEAIERAFLQHICSQVEGVRPPVVTNLIWEP